MNRQSKECFKVVKLFYDTTMVGTYLLTFVQTYRMYDTKNGLEFKLWISGNNKASMQVHQIITDTLMQDVDSGRNYTFVGIRDMWKFYTFYSQFFCEAKTTLFKVY